MQWEDISVARSEGGGAAIAACKGSDTSPPPWKVKMRILDFGFIHGNQALVLSEDEDHTLLFHQGEDDLHKLISAQRALWKKRLKAANFLMV